jgi:hypothetical protein
MGCLTHDASCSVTKRPLSLEMFCRRPPPIAHGCEKVQSITTTTGAKLVTGTPEVAYSLASWGIWRYGPTFLPTSVERQVT